MGPGPTDQVNLTDEESRIMPMPGGGFEQCYNAQAAVVAGGLLVIANDVVWLLVLPRDTWNAILVSPAT